MEKIFKINDSQIGTLLDLLEERKSKHQDKLLEAKAQFEKLQQEEKEIDEMIRTLKKETNVDGIATGTPFPGGGSWWEKISWALNNRKRVTSAALVVDFILEHEGSLSGEGKRLATVNIFATLSNKSKANKVSRIKENGEFFYGLNEWFDKDNNLMPRYDNNS